MAEFVKGKFIAEGKTKTLHEVLDVPGMAFIGNKTAITAFDDPIFTREIESKARFATTTTSRVFELSKQAFRDGEALSAVEKKYGIVADLVSRPEFMKFE